MPSGMKKIVSNFNERILSSDLNRMQDLHSRDAMELFRCWLNTTQQEDLQCGGVGTAYSTLETPLRALIFGSGFLVRPQAASLNLFVDNGVLACIAPDADPDVSNFKYVRDSGISIVGALPMTANASGSTRIDVIECRPSPTPEIVTDLRDIFNESTKLYIGRVVTKETRTVLEYRVRTGTPGAGYPGNALGWLPLTIASVPASTSTVDGMRFWDVRPLLNDNIDSPSSNTELRSGVIGQGTQASNNTAKLFGCIHAKFKGKKAGGSLYTWNGLAEQNFLDTSGINAATETDPTNPPTGFSFALAGLYATFPFGLPRWVRYAQTGSRLPSGTRGILVWSSIAVDQNGHPSAAINAPTLYGLGSGAATTDAVCLVTLITSGGGTVADAAIFRTRVTTQYQPLTVSGSGPYNATVSEGTHVPANVSMLKVNYLIAANTLGAVTQCSHKVSLVPSLAGTSPTDNLGELTQNTSSNLVQLPVGANGGQFTAVDWLQVPKFEDFSPTAADHVVRVTQTGLTPTAVTISVTGWET